MLSLLYIALSMPEAAAEPLPIVAVGGGLVAGPPAATADPTVPGGWVPVLADCLEERAPQRFTVVDRAVTGETLASVRTHLADVRTLGPAWVVLTLGARELAESAADPKALRDELSAVFGELRSKKQQRPNLLVIGMVPPTLSQVEGTDPASLPAGQEAIDSRTSDWNKVLAEIAARSDGAVLDLWSDWPKDAAERAALTARGWSLSDQGHARVAAAVCDAVLAVRP